MLYKFRTATSFGPSIPLSNQIKKTACKLYQTQGACNTTTAPKSISATHLSKSVSSALPTAENASPQGQQGHLDVPHQTGNALEAKSRGPFQCPSFAIHPSASTNNKH
ncbi:hypothetical protein Nepgr_012473 [Nepenthes gracilis]|uniref:Uncharacterized protein n=1 Tax=Nepenthes gracilis TaxID=150966 RepID=A0AAD3XMU2_NEPGR|nr:hypothetical protein Nepgr_012473 [Nepenthes gracilis]